ncbi:unnamed protein product [Heterobilharzia americana]|nr:unnamed protein product [Heterobilharzia americana]
MKKRTLSLIFHSFSIVCILSALSYNQWYCGGVLNCLKYYKTDTILLILAFSIGSAFLIMAFVLDLITLCSERLDLNPTFATTRLLLSISAFASISAAILIYSNQMDRQYSFLMCTISTVLAVQVVIINLSRSQCACASRNSRVITS